MGTARWRATGLTGASLSLWISSPGRWGVSCWAPWRWTSAIKSGARPRITRPGGGGRLELPLVALALALFRPASRLEGLGALVASRGCSNRFRRPGPEGRAERPALHARSHQLLLHTASATRCI